MANLNLIKQLNIKYDKSSPIRSLSTKIPVNEGFNSDRLEKAFTSQIASLGPQYSRYFDFGLPATVALLFIDVCDFSTRFKDLNGEGIGKYFDGYYDTVLPLIYKHGGEVEKIIGDGIIAVFGPPFTENNVDDNIESASDCAKEIIKRTIDTNFSSKIAFHCGEIFYFKNKSGIYEELTMIGKPLTELFRLESISEDNCINYFDNTLIRSYYKERFKGPDKDQQSNNVIPWSHYGKLINNIKGIDYTQFFRIRYNKPK